MVLKIVRGYMLTEAMITRHRPVSHAQLVQCLQANRDAANNVLDLIQAQARNALFAAGVVERALRAWASHHGGGSMWWGSPFLAPLVSMHGEVQLYSSGV